MFKKFKNKKNRSKNDDALTSQMAGIMNFNTKEVWNSLCNDNYIRFDNHPDVKICIKKISDLISSMTIYLMKNEKGVGNIREINGLSKMLDINPNPFLTRQKLIKAVVEEFLVYGNSILIPKYKATSEFEFVEEMLEGLYHIPQSKINYVDKKDGSYTIKINNSFLNYDDVIHFTYNQTKERAWLGEGLKVYLNEIIKSLNNTNTIKNDYYTNQYKPNIVFSFNADTADFTTSEQREALNEKWLKTKPGTPYILPAHLIDFKSFSPMSLRDIAINENVELDKKIIANMFGLPLFMIGLGEFNEQEYNNFIDTTISPIVKGMAQELTKKLIISPNYYIKFNLDSLKSFKTEEKIDMMLRAKALGVFNANEIRVAAGYDPINDKNMNEFNLLENYIPIDKLGDQKKLKQEKTK